MTTELKKLTEMHNDWVCMAKSLEAGDYSEDVVQEAYIRIFKYATPDAIVKNGIPNKMYMWSTIRNVIFDHRKKKNRLNTISLNKVDYNIANDNDVQMWEAREDLEACIESEINKWHWYDARLFRIYRESGKSMRLLSKETGISLTSIFTTLKHCKRRLRENVGEDYTDFFNQDYELLKNN